MLPLENLRVIDFSQFLAGPVCSLRLADLGAEVIKIERPDVGDICRQLYISNQMIGNESTLFHAINRNKKSVSINLKDHKERIHLENLLKTADVVIQNFRPGVAKKLSIDYDSIKKINPKIVYGSISGYGSTTDQWYTKPGQDLLAQSISGVMYLNNNEKPMPLGLSMADLTAGYDLTQGILSLLVRRGITAQGGLVETSLLESLVNFFNTELIEYNQSVNNSYSMKFPHVYTTKDKKFLTISPFNVEIIRKIMPLENPTIESVSNEFSAHNFDYWVSICHKNHISMEEVLNWNQLTETDYYKSLQFEQIVKNKDNLSLKTTRCPIKIDNNYFYSEIGAPAVGEHNSLF